MSLTPEQLYKEIKGTLAPGEDPSGAGSQALTYGYRAGDGTTLSDKTNLLNAAQSSTSPRPITVQLRDPSKVGPGVISDTVAVQVLKTAVDPDEDMYMELLMQNPDTLVTPTVEDQAKWTLAKELYMTGQSGEGQFLYTDEFQAQFVDAVPGNIMPNTRANLQAAVQRDGSRAQEMTGIQFSDDDLRAAEQWRFDNDPGSPSVYD